MSGRVVLARDLDSALAAATPGALLLAGGTAAYADAGPAGTPPPAFVSLRRIPELAGIRLDGEWLDIGAATTMDDLIRSGEVAAAAPVLARAAASMGSRQIRARATVGGNLATARNDHTLAPVLLALDAKVVFGAADGPETLPVSEVLDRFHNGAVAGAIITRVRVPVRAGLGAFTRVGRRNGPCYATASTALWLAPGPREVRLGIGGAAPTAIRAPQAEAYAVAHIDWEQLSAPAEVCAEFGRLAASACDPVSDRISSAAYRRHAVEVMSRRLLENAVGGQDG